MRYLIKQKIISLNDGFTVKDEAGNDCFKIKGKFISFGKKLTLLGMDGQELCFIQQKPLKLFAEYHLLKNSQKVMTVKQKPALFGKKFNLSGSTGDYQVEGNIIARDFRIAKNSGIVATISKKFVALSDTYTVDISDSEDPTLMLSVAIVLDMICHSNN